jgi:hypothetical protein
LSHETAAHAAGVFVFARFLALGDTRLAIAHRGHTFFFALRPRRIALARTLGTWRFWLIVDRIFRRRCSGIDDEQCRWRSESCRRFRDGFCGMCIVRLDFSDRRIVAASKLPHA